MSVPKNDLAEKILAKLKEGLGEDGTIYREVEAILRAMTGEGECRCAQCEENRRRDPYSPFYIGPLPTRDDSKPNSEQGLYRKFDVRRTDGSDAPGGKHHGCEYFVLDVRHDKAAKAALTAYADAIEATHPDLARDMRERYEIDAAPPPPLRDAGAVRDPHHGGDCWWKWEGGQLFHAGPGVPKKWVPCKKIGATPARIRAVAEALALAHPAPPQEAGEAVAHPSDWRRWLQWAKDNPGAVYGWAADTWEGPPSLRDHQTSMHMIPLVPVWKVLDLEDRLGIAAESEPQSCREADGCPTEGAVLRREWRDMKARLATPTPDKAWPDDAAVERALAAFKRSRGTYEGEVPIDADDMRAALTAAARPERGGQPE